MASGKGVARRTSVADRRLLAVRLFVRRLVRGLVFWTLTLALVVATVVTGSLLHVARSPDLPSVEGLAAYRTLSSTRVLDRGGLLLGEIGSARHTPVPFVEMAAPLVSAATAHDPAFLGRDGLHVVGVLRALGAVVGFGDAREGRGPIALEVARVAFPTRAPGLRRTLEEIALAAKLTWSLPRQTIVELRLNYGDYGARRFGCEEAAKYLFGKRAAAVDLAEGALLVALLGAEEKPDPRKRPQAAKAAQCRVLRQLAAVGTIDDARAHALCLAPLAFGRPPRGGAVYAPEVVGWVERALAHEHSRGRLETLGLSARTTIDLDLQVAAQEVVERALEAFDARHGAAPAAGSRAAARASAAAAPMPDNAIVSGLIQRVEGDPAHKASGRLFVDVGGRPGVVDLSWEARYTAGVRPLAARIGRGDLVRVRLARERRVDGEGDDPVEAPLALELGPQAALVALDPRSREIRALVGGYGAVPGRPDRTQRARPPGPLLAPFVYGAALESRKKTALALRRPFVAGRAEETARLALEVGPALLRDFAARAGVLAPTPDGEAGAEIAVAVQPLEVANAFATLVGAGRPAVPELRQSDHDRAAALAASVPVIQPDVAYLTVSLLESAAKEGAARALGARFPGVPLGGLPALAGDGGDAWFVAFSSELVVVAWVGFDDGRPLPAGGPNPAAEMALAFVERALAGRPVPPPVARPRRSCSRMSIPPRATPCRARRRGSTSCSCSARSRGWSGITISRGPRGRPRARASPDPRSTSWRPGGFRHRPRPLSFDRKVCP